MKKAYWCIVFCVLFVGVSACSFQKKDLEKQKNLEIEILSEEEIPEELYAQIEKQGMKEFEITYCDQNILYFAKGYGRKPTSGYTVQVTECYEASNGVCIHTELLGPSKKEKVIREERNPYIVIKILNMKNKEVFHGICKK